MSYIADQLSAAIRDACKARGWSLSKLAREADLSLPSLFNVAKGTQMPTLDTLDKICRALGADAIVDGLCAQIRSSASDANSG